MDDSIYDNYQPSNIGGFYETPIFSQNYSTTRYQEGGRNQVFQTASSKPSGQTDVKQKPYYRNCIKRLTISVVILFLMCSAFTITSMVMIYELKQDTFQKSLEMKQLALLQKNLSKGIENRDLRQNEIQQERDSAALLSRIQGIQRSLEKVNQKQSRQEESFVAVLPEIQFMIKMFPKSCDNLDLDFISEGSGLAIRVFPFPGGVEAYCQKLQDQMWTVFQRRKDGSVDFFRGWNEYVNGFGDANGDFWLGLEAIHQMTKTGQYQLRIDMEVQNGTRVYAAYSSFSIGSGSEYYPLRISGYTGNATDSLKGHNNRKFTTKDADNDHSINTNCALLYHGAWWYSSCHNSNLNGLYGDASSSGVAWWQLNQTRGFNLMNMRLTEMKLKKKQ